MKIETKYDLGEKVWAKQELDGLHLCCLDYRQPNHILMGEMVKSFKISNFFCVPGKKKTLGVLYNCSPAMLMIGTPYFREAELFKTEVECIGFYHKAFLEIIKKYRDRAAKNRKERIERHMKEHEEILTLAREAK